MPILLCQKMPHAKDLPLPRYQSEGAAGMDLMAAVAEDTPLRLEIGARALIPTGLQIALAEGYEAQIRPRSGLAFKHGITVLNSPGTIDWDYRGEIKILLINLGQEAFIIHRGERVAQMVIAPVTQVDLKEVNKLDDTKRGDAGYGSTGVV